MPLEANIYAQHFRIFTEHLQLKKKEKNGKSLEEV